MTNFHLGLQRAGIVPARTVFGPLYYLTETEEGPSLDPLIGNWQEACQSHYWIAPARFDGLRNGRPGQIAAGHRREEQRRQAYYEKL